MVMPECSISGPNQNNIWNRTDDYGLSVILYPWRIADWIDKFIAFLLLVALSLSMHFGKPMSSYIDCLKIAISYWSFVWCPVIWLYLSLTDLFTMSEKKIICKLTQQLCLGGMWCHVNTVMKYDLTASFWAWSSFLISDSHLYILMHNMIQSIWKKLIHVILLFPSHFFR